MRSQIRPAVVSLILLTIITGVIYPVAVTGIALLAFPHKARGSIIVRDGRVVGSELIAQPFTDAKYFWPRPSAANYNGAVGSGSNLAPSNPALAEAVQARVIALRAADPTNILPVPVDLVTASGSGLDPHISVAAARYQVPRVARARGMSLGDVDTLLASHIEPRTFGVLGGPRVKVVQLNFALDHPAATTQSLGGSGNIAVYRYRGFLPDAR